MTQPDAARVERGPITENVRFKPLSEEEINNLWEGVYFALGMAALLERQGFTVAAAEMRRLHAQRDALLEALKAMLHMVERHAPVGLAPTQDSPVAKARSAIKAAEENT